ncbi:MAG: hypothetical protein ABJB04_03135 [Betaproteobacteria bacterium]
MNRIPSIAVSATVAALVACLSLPVAAQSTGTTGGGGNTASTMTFQQRLNKISAANNGRITRDIYMKEAGQDWDAMDKEHHGLTRDEINRMYFAGAKMGGPTAKLPQVKKGLQQ